MGEPNRSNNKDNKNDDISFNSVKVSCPGKPKRYNNSEENDDKVELKVRLGKPDSLDVEEGEIVEEIFLKKLLVGEVVVNHDKTDELFLFKLLSRLVNQSV